MVNTIRAAEETRGACIERLIEKVDVESRKRFYKLKYLAEEGFLNDRRYDSYASNVIDRMRYIQKAMIYALHDRFNQAKEQIDLADHIVDMYIGNPRKRKINQRIVEKYRRAIIDNFIEGKKKGHDKHS